MLSYEEQDLCRNCIQLLSSDSDLGKNIVKKITAVTSHAEKDFISIQHITKIDHCTSENWNLIKEYFRSSSKSCIWLQVPSEMEIFNKLRLEERIRLIHMEAYRIKMKYDFLLKDYDTNNFLKVWTELYRHSLRFRIVDEWRKYGFECYDEVKKMSLEMVCKDINLYDFVLQDKPETQIGLHRQEKHLELVKKFPNYGEIIASALERAYQLRTKHLKVMQEIRMFTKNDDGQEITLDYGSVITLANYLNDSDVQNLVKIFK